MDRLPLFCTVRTQTWHSRQNIDGWERESLRSQQRNARRCNSRSPHIPKSRHSHVRKICNYILLRAPRSTSPTQSPCLWISLDCSSRCWTRYRHVKSSLKKREKISSHTQDVSVAITPTSDLERAQKTSSGVLSSYMVYNWATTHSRDWGTR